MKRDITLLKNVVSNPTTSFFEQRVAKFVICELERLNVPFEIDKWGNILAFVKRGKTRIKLGFTAHMDHPGIEILNKTTARLLGGVPDKYFTNDVNVVLYSDNGRKTKGVVRNFREEDRKRLFDLETETGVISGFGVWDLEDFRLEEDGTMHMRAADDLAGVASILAMLRKLVKADYVCDVTCIFTRAEEVGLVGATLTARAGSLSKDTVIISVETSKELPGAIIGEGPVIRVGDASSVFSYNADQLLKTAASKLLKSDKEFKVQRQLMSGGVCEASCFILFGYTTIGIALPLGNYHNKGPDDKLASEIIHQDDFLNAVKLYLQVCEISGNVDIKEPAIKDMLIEMADSQSERLVEDAIV